MIVDITAISPKLLTVLAFLLNWCAERDITPSLTSLIRTASQNNSLYATSQTHVEGRAVDISIHGWTPLEVSELKRELRERYWRIGAISPFTYERRLVLEHDNGNGNHLHIQVSP